MNSNELTQTEVHDKNQCSFFTASTKQWVPVSANLKVVSSLVARTKLNNYYFSITFQYFCITM